jgi:FAD/FMN-containing dehydrogenase
MVRFGLNVSFFLLVYAFQTIFVITICHAEHKFVRANNNELQACLSSSLPSSVRTIYPCITSTNQNSSQYQCDHFNVSSLSAHDGGRIPHSPAVVVHVTNSSDVQKVVKCATKLNYTVNPSGGGHSYEGYGLGSTHNNIIINLAGINYINIDESDKTTRIGAGARLGPIYYKTYQFDNYTINGGTCVWVGIAGQTLGGGAGFLSRLHGLLSDNVLEMKAVNAEGRYASVLPPILNRN